MPDVPTTASRSSCSDGRGFATFQNSSATPTKAKNATSEPTNQRNAALRARGARTLLGGFFGSWVSW
jgi:hypothetical protein